MLAGREISSRYRSSLLGLLWAIIVPMALLGIYTFVFTVLFSPRGGSNINRIDFALSLFCGLTVYNIFADSVGKAPSLVISYKNLVKRQRFPVHVLPWINVASALVNSVFSFAILILATAVIKRGIPLDILLLPVLIAPYLILLTGLVYLISALGVYVRDIGQGMPLILRIAMFVTPVFYPVTLIPEQFRIYMFFNPIAFFVHETRKALLLQDPFNWAGYGIYFAASIVALLLGAAAFNKMRPGFADVL